MDFNKLCFGCMRERREAEGACPFCGFDLAKYEQNARCLRPGTVLAGKYLIGKVIGVGGFGITYMGFDLNMQVAVAIKEYFPVELVSRDTTAPTGSVVFSLEGSKKSVYKNGLEKYVTEARSISRFEGQPGIVSIKDFFYENETAYIVMEYIDGVSLKEYLKQRGGSLSEEETLRLMEPLLDALEKVHAAGITHRDISPDNIMLTKTGEIRLIDFGAARMTEKNDERSLTIILKHGYAPEEQYRTHGEQGTWTDVYALCATMYRMLTGEVPTPAMDRIFRDELVNVRNRNSGVSKKTEEAIMKGLAVKKEQRIQTVAELREGLYGKGLKKENKKTVLWAGVGAACLGVGILAAAFAFGGSRGPNLPAVTAVAETEEIQSQQPEGQNQKHEEADIVYLEEEEETEEAVGEQIAFPVKEKLVATGNYFVLAVQEDGTVEARGDNGNGQCDVEDWHHVVQVSAGYEYAVGLRSDGKVFLAGGEFLEEGLKDVENWSDIVSIDAGDQHVIGLKKDGTVLTAGYNVFGCCEVGDWTDIQEVYADQCISIGIKSDHTIMLAGGGEDFPAEVADWTDVEKILWCHYDGGVIAKKTDGSLLAAESKDYLLADKWKAWGNLEALVSSSGPVGLLPDGTLRDGQNFGGIEELQNLTDVVEIYAGNGPLAVLQADGTVHVTCRVFGEEPDSLESFTDIRQISLSNTGEIGAVQNSGKGLFFSTEEDWYGICASLEGRSDLQKIYITDDLGEGFIIDTNATATKLEDYEPRSWEGVSDIYDMQGFIVRLHTDGTVSYEDGIYNGAEREDIREALTVTKDWADMKQLQEYHSGILGLKNDGTLMNSRSILHGHGAAEEGWEKIQSIDTSPLGYNLVAVKEDGTVLYEGENDKGQGNVHGWSDIVKAETSAFHTVGLKADGTVVAVGKNNNGMCDVSDWTDIKDIAVCDTCTVGITEDGTLKIAGWLQNDWDNMEPLKAGVGLLQKEFCE